jgi:putative MATE family efflux protein
VVAENLLATLTQVVGMIMVGHLGAAAITAVGLSFQPLWLIQGFFMGLGAGTTALVARLTGAGQHQDTVAVARQGLLLAALLAAVCGALTLPFTGAILALMGAAPDVRELGSIYLVNLLPGMLLMMVSTIVSAVLRGAGDTRTPMWVSIAVNLLNIILCWVLIFGKLGLPALGIAGAGLATTLARSVGAVALVATLLHPRTVVHIDLRAFRPLWTFFRPEPSVIARIFRVGIPAAAERMANSLGQICFARVAATLGTVAFAAHSLAINVESISYMPGIGFSVAATTLVGQHLGAGRPAEATKSAWECARLGLLIMGSMGIVFFLFPTPLLRLYTDDPAVIALGVMALRIVAFIQVPEALGFVLSGALRGAGDTRSVLRITAACVWIVRLGTAVIFIFVFHLGLLGAWLAMSLDWIIRAIYLVLRFRSGAWKEVRV